MSNPFETLSQLRWYKDTTGWVMSYYAPGQHQRMTYYPSLVTPEEIMEAIKDHVECPIYKEEQTK